MVTNNVPPDVFTYTYLIASHAEHNNNVTRARELLRLCPDPNIRTYNAVSNAESPIQKPRTSGRVVETHGDTECG